MTPAERARYLVRGPYVRPLLDAYDLDDLEDLVTKAICDAIAQEREACCQIVFSQCGSDNVAQRTVDAIRNRE